MIIEIGEFKLLTLEEFILHGLKFTVHKIKYVEIILIWIIGEGDNNLCFLIIKKCIITLFNIVNGNCWHIFGLGIISFLFVCYLQDKNNAWFNKSGLYAILFQVWHINPGTFIFFNEVGERKIFKKAAACWSSVVNQYTFCLRWLVFLKKDTGFLQLDFYVNKLLTFVNAYESVHN